MDCTIVQKEIEEIKPSNILSQTPFWGRLKDKQGFQPKGFEISVSKDTLFSHGDVQGNQSDDLLVLIKYIDATHCFAYVPYGPELEPEFENQGVFLEQLSETIKPYLPHNCIFIRYDLAWQNQWSADDDYFDAHGNWTGPPDEQVQEFRVNYKTINWRLKKARATFYPRIRFFWILPSRKIPFCRTCVTTPATT